jgi:hypothetical protein
MRTFFYRVNQSASTVDLARRLRLATEPRRSGGFFFQPRRKTSEQLGATKERILRNDKTKNISHERKVNSKSIIHRVSVKFNYNILQGIRTHRSSKYAYEIMNLQREATATLMPASFGKSIIHRLCCSAELQTNDCRAWKIRPV